MRKVRVAAIQPGYMNIPGQYSCMSEEYISNPSVILEKYIQPQLYITCDLLEKAGEDGCDIVVTSEDITGLSEYSVDITGRNIFPGLVWLSQELAGERLSQIAAKHSMYVIGCYFKKVNDSIYNAAVIFDRGGKIIGEYWKTHLPFNEKWQCTPGDEIKVFDLDFGRIGICICYDMMFPEFVQVLGLKGAEIVFHPTLGYGWYDEIGEATLRTRANDNSVYIVTSKNYSYNSAGKSSVVDFWGQALAQAGFYKNTVITKDIDLEFKKEQPAWYYATQTSGIGEVNLRKSVERRPELYTSICEPLRGKYDGPDHQQKAKIFRNIKTGTCHW